MKGGAFCRRGPGRRDDRKKEEIETRMSLLPGKTASFEVSRNHFDNNEL